MQTKASSRVLGEAASVAEQMPEDDEFVWCPPRFIGEIRPDEDFDTPECNRVAPFDPDVADARLCHLTAGAGVKFTPEELRDWFRAGDAPTSGQRAAAVEALMQLGCMGLRDLAGSCGASIRDMAHFFRITGPRHWTTVSFINSRSKTGNDELPPEIDKNILAGNIDHWL